jgi:hypothetical protein
MTFKTKYLLAKQNGLVDRFRGDEISRRISSEYPLSAQIAIALDREDDEEKWNAYQSFRASVKKEVDQLIAEVEEEYETI